MPSGGLTKGLYVRHHCWALDGFKLGGLFYFSLLLRVFIFLFFKLLTYHQIHFFEQNVSVLTGLKYFKMAPRFVYLVAKIRYEECCEDQLNAIKRVYVNKQ